MVVFKVYLEFIAAKGKETKNHCLSFASSQLFNIGHNYYCFL